MPGFGGGSCGGGETRVYLNVNMELLGEAVTSAKGAPTPDEFAKEAMQAEIYRLRLQQTQQYEQSQDTAGKLAEAVGEIQRLYQLALRLKERVETATVAQKETEENLLQVRTQLRHSEMTVTALTERSSLLNVFLNVVSGTVFAARTDKTPRRFQKALGAIEKLVADTRLKLR